MLPRVLTAGGAPAGGSGVADLVLLADLNLAADLGLAGTFSLGAGRLITLTFSPSQGDSHQYAKTTLFSLHPTQRWLTGSASWHTPEQTWKEAAGGG